MRRPAERLRGGANLQPSQPHQTTEAPASARRWVKFAGYFAPRYSVGVQPIQRLKAREKTSALR